MKLYDRFTNKIVLSQNLPQQIDFGRYATLHKDSSIKEDITFSNFDTDKVIHQELLLEKNKSIQDVFVDIAIDGEKAENIDYEVIPIIRRIKNKLGLNEFEELLYEKLFHLEEIFRVPHYLLKRTIEKVHVSRAKRISSKSYQYLASHTEDWVHKSIVSFKPSRILNEELELNFDIYENQLTVAFLERCLIYLNSRLKEIQDIKSFLSEYQKLLKNRDDEQGWYKKINRNLSLIGAVYEDEHYSKDGKDGAILTETEEKLSQMNRRLQLLRKRDLFDAVNHRVAQSVSLRNTNVLVNHKHYRYIKSLWLELDKVKPEQSETDKIKLEQDIIKGLRVYAKSLIRYTLKNNLDYDLEGNYMAFDAEHLHLDNIQFKENNRGTFEIKIGKHELKVIVLGNRPSVDEETLKGLKERNIYIFYYHETATVSNNRLVRINPLDADSVERIGLLIRKFLLSSFLGKIHQVYDFTPSLRDYVKYIPLDFLTFDLKEFSYQFHSYPKAKLSPEDILEELGKDEVFKKQSRSRKENIKAAITELVTEIDANAIKLKENYLNCFYCAEKYYEYHTDSLDYIECSCCKSLLDSSKPNKNIFRINDTRYEKLGQLDFGMDYITYNHAEL